MPGDDRSGGQLQVMVQDGVAYLRLHDRGTFKISKAMKQFGVSTVEQGATSIVVDMRECVGMDSTFMGVLAGLAVRLKKKNGGKITLVNLSPRTRGLLATLGLDQLVETYMIGDTPADMDRILASVTANMSALEHTEASKRETSEMMLEAHEELVALTPENKPRFKDVLTFLREDVERAAHEGPVP